MKTALVQACCVLITNLFLNGCASQAPYGTTESSARLVADLSLREPPAVVVPAEWTSSEYGLVEPGSTVVGLLVSKPNGLQFVTYSDDRYRQVDELSRPALQCGYIWKGEDSAEALHLFAADKFYLLMIRENGRDQIDAGQRLQMIRHLRALGVPLLTEQNGPFVRATGKTVMQTTKVLGSWISLPHVQHEAFNPCKPQEN